MKYYCVVYYFVYMFYIFVVELNNRYEYSKILLSIVHTIKYTK